jgi:hypothetical protein
VSYREALGGFEDRLFGEFWELKDSVYGSHPGTSEGMGGNPARWLGYYRADDALVRDGCLRAAVIADSTEVFLSI